MAEEPSWNAAVQKNDPLLMERLNGLRELAFKDGALPKKVKTLMMFMCLSLHHLDTGAGYVAGLCREAGATEEEICETLHVVLMMGGMPALACGGMAFRS